MNKVNVMDYINPSWNVSDIIVEPSQELVNKWMSLLEYKSQSTSMDNDYIYTTPRVEPKDRFEISRNLEFLERVYAMDFRQCWPQNDVYKPEMIAKYRKDTTEIKKKVHNVIVECEPSGYKCKQNNKIKIKVKRLHPDAVIPSQAKDDDAGYDLVAIEDGSYPVPNTTNILVFRTGLAIQPQEGYHVEVFPRSSVAKYDLMLKNSIGLIDYGYRGELILKFQIMEPKGNAYMTYRKGDKIAQMVIRKTIHADFEDVQDGELDSSERGTGGFGSSTGELHIVASATNVGKSSFKHEEMNQTYKSIGVDTRMV